MSQVRGGSRAAPGRNESQGQGRPGDKVSVTCILFQHSQESSFQSPLTEQQGRLCRAQSIFPQHRVCQVERRGAGGVEGAHLGALCSALHAVGNVTAQCCTQ
ncbi:hypothetical protein H1C71_039659 [Ictidomys tridecemlineatus]|nr:hypothetical protein H1C71_039659 [Ictidomys tridecemlineatus]